MRVVVRVRPGASRERVGGHYGAAAHAALVVAVTARAVDGAATAAVLKAVAAAFDVRLRDVTLVSGATHRNKVLDIDLPESLGALRLRELLDSRGSSV